MFKSETKGAEEIGSVMECAYSVQEEEHKEEDEATVEVSVPKKKGKRDLPNTCAGCRVQLCRHNCTSIVVVRGKRVSAGPRCYMCDVAYEEGRIALVPKYSTKDKCADAFAQDDHLKEQFAVARALMDNLGMPKPFHDSDVSKGRCMGCRAFRMFGHQNLVAARGVRVQGSMSIPSGQPEVQHMIYSDKVWHSQDSVLKCTEQLFEG